MTILERYTITDTERPLEVSWEGGLHSINPDGRFYSIVARNIYSHAVYHSPVNHENETGKSLVSLLLGPNRIEAEVAHPDPKDLKSPALIKITTVAVNLPS